jgi:hypothetical protein
MIAPANFGSPLAHKGKSFIGRVTKGFNGSKVFETGKQILDALEMASPFIWQLTERDRFQKNPFNPKEIHTTVLIGNKGHGGIKSIANEVGSDGVVYTCSASMEAALVKLDFSHSETPQNIPPKPCLGKTAL